MKGVSCNVENLVKGQKGSKGEPGDRGEFKLV